MPSAPPSVHLGSYFVLQHFATVSKAFIVLYDKRKSTSYFVPISSGRGTIIVLLGGAAAAF